MRTICDENLSEIFNGLGFSESFTFIDIKLALGLLTVALSGGLFLLEKKVPFKDSYYPTIAILVVYFIASGLLWLLAKHPQYKDIKYMGYSKDGKKITVSTSTTKYDPIYHIDLKFDQGETQTFKVEFMKLFDDFTNFHPDKLQEILNNEISKVNKKKM